MAGELTPDAQAALAFAPIGQQMMDTLRPMLPQGTHFGVFILVKGESEGSVPRFSPCSSTRKHVTSPYEDTRLLTDSST